MQTFLPFQDFARCARVLDRARLQKQLVEVTQIMDALQDPEYGWQYHPTVNMWRGHWATLVQYGKVMYDEWKRRFRDGERGGKLLHKSGEKIMREYERLAAYMDDSYARPEWMGEDRLHRTHRSCLLAKNEQHYQQFGWQESPTPAVNGKWPYYWPV